MPRQAGGVMRGPALLVSAVIAGLLAIGIVVAGGHVASVHTRYGVWAWTPGAATPRLPFDGRTYLRGRPVSGLAAGAVRVGEGPDGAALFAMPAPAGAAATGLWARYPDGRIVSYTLSGGP